MGSEMCIRDRPYYEHVFITRPEIAPQQVENLVEEIKTVINDNGGKSVYTEYWGLRDLAYKIKKSERGHYSLIRISSPSTAIQELERIQKLNEDVLRYLTIKTDDLSEESSPIMKASLKKEGSYSSSKGS